MPLALHLTWKKGIVIIEVSVTSFESLFDHDQETLLFVNVVDCEKVLTLFGYWPKSNAVEQCATKMAHFPISSLRGEITLLHSYH